MTKQSGAVDVSSFTTDAKFRTWGLACSTALQACGLVKTSDTGQVNWATVLKPTTTNAKAGYEIYRFADTLQSTKPVFIRFDFGSSVIASGNSLSTWMTVGTGSDGAGAITGPVVGPVQSNTNSATVPSNASMLYQFTHSTTPGYLLANFGLEVYAASQVTAGVFILERTKDATGAATGDGLAITYLGTSTPQIWIDYAINFNTYNTYQTGSRPPVCGAASVAISTTTGTNISLFRHYTAPGVVYPLVGRLSHFAGDIANTVVFTATPVGSTSHSYYCWNLSKSGDSSGSANIVLDWMWED